MLMRVFLALLALLAVVLPAHAATRAQMITPANTSVLAGETQVYSVRFTNADGSPAVGEAVRFSNDVCGFFQNGLISITVATNSNGVASATFKARPQGITCWVTAVAPGGVGVTFNVYTYTEPLIYLDGVTTPESPRVAQPFTFTAGVFQGAYPIYEADISARVIPGTISATISPGSGNMGQSRSGVDFEVKPQDLVGDFEVEVTHRGVSRRFQFTAGPAPLQDMWWGGPAENGWGLSMVQHGDKLFSVIYAYDALGKPVWYVMPGGTWNEARTQYTGELYFPTGTPFTNYDATKLVANAPVGSATITFDAASRATLKYTIDGTSGTKQIRRQLFGPAEDGAPLEGLGDMWWGGPQQNGWGIALLQQYKALFGVWFTYDAEGKPTWFVMPSGRWATLDSYEGRMFRTTGSPWVGQNYDANALKPVDVGSFKFRFGSAGTTFDYVIDGRAGAIALERQGF